MFVGSIAKAALRCWLPVAEFILMSWQDWRRKVKKPTGMKVGIAFRKVNKKSAAVREEMPVRSMVLSEDC